MFHAEVKPPSWSKVGMEITPRELNQFFSAKDIESHASSLESGWTNTFFSFLGLVFLTALLSYLWISRRMQKQDNVPAEKEELPEEKGLQNKILDRMTKAEERIEVLEGFVQHLSQRRVRAVQMGDQVDSD